MEFSKVLVSRPEFKDLQKGLSSEHFHAEVVLIDRSTPATPHVYQLKSDYFIHSYLNEEDAFINIGDLLELDPLKKHMRLANGNQVTYKYLIDFSGKEHPLELAAALHALKDALLMESSNIREKIQTSYSQEKAEHSFSATSTEQGKKAKNIERLVQMLSMQHEDGLGGDIAASAKSRCQVKL